MHFPYTLCNVTKNKSKERKKAYFYLYVSKRFISRHSIANYFFFFHSALPSSYRHRNIHSEAVHTLPIACVCVVHLLFISLHFVAIDLIIWILISLLGTMCCCYSFSFQFGANTFVFVSHLLLLLCLFDSSFFFFLLHSFQFWFSRALWLPDVKTHFYHHLSHALLYM